MAQFTEPPVVSPDGRYVVTVTQRGLLPQGALEATMWLFTKPTSGSGALIDDPASSQQPVALAQLSATVNGDGFSTGQIILRPTWDADSSGILFIGRDGRENRQLFHVRLADRSTTVLSRPTQDVVEFAAAGTTVVFFAGPDVREESHWWSTDATAHDIINGTGQSLIDLLYPNYQRIGRNMPTEFELWQVEDMRGRPVIDPTTSKPLQVLGSYNVSMLAVSPRGEHVVAVTNAESVPSSWERYALPAGDDLHPFIADSPTTDREADYSRALQYQVVDLRTGSVRPLVAAPVADYQRGGMDPLQAVWSFDEKFVAVSETYLPVDGGRGAKGFDGQCAVAVVALQTHAVQCLVDRSKSAVSTAVQSLDWSKQGYGLTVTTKDGSANYRRVGSRWQLSHVDRTGPAAIPSMAIRQSLNEPPALFAMTGTDAKGRKIFDPNPQLRDIALGVVSPYTWTDARGRTLQGGLAKPPDFKPGQRYSLVIQTHGFSPREFFRNGYSETANAGRALAGRGMLVLQVTEPEDEMVTWHEGTIDGTEVYVAAIDQLSKEGLVDPTKVGITGYSRSGFYVAKAITDMPDRFAAAMISNADPGSLIGYDSYIDYGMPSYAKLAADTFAGVLPYGDGLQQWLERAPGFRTDRIRAPVLISAADPQHLISLWGIYAPLRDQHKPVELQYIRSGQHNLTQPLQIVAHQEMLVDWFDFWLNQHEDPDPGKVGQYERWRKMVVKVGAGR